MSSSSVVTVFGPRFAGGPVDAIANGLAAYIVDRATRQAAQIMVTG